MSADAPGPSKHINVEEQAREKNKSYWEFSQEMEDAEAAELAHVGDADFQLEMENAEDTSGDGDATTTNGGDHMDIGGEDHTDVGDGGNLPAAKKPKKQRKDRTPQAVATVTDTFT